MFCSIIQQLHTIFFLFKNIFLRIMAEKKFYLKQFVVHPYLGFEKNSVLKIAVICAAKKFFSSNFTDDYKFIFN